MNEVYNLIYVIVKNYCISTGCENCSFYEPNIQPRTLIKRCILTLYVNPLDRLSSILRGKSVCVSPSPTVKQLWDVFMKHCNNHFIYGRFDCCSGCKFRVTKAATKYCLLDPIWRTMKRC